MKKELNVVSLSVLSIVFLLMIGYALADLPVQGNHDGTWGTHLNSWLDISHNLTSGNVDNITDGNITGADLDDGIQINASSVRIGNASMAAARNITGIFINTSLYMHHFNVSAASCTEFYVNMSGLPGDVPCFVSRAFNATTTNVTVIGMNSTEGNGRALVCTNGGARIDIGVNASMSMMCIASSNFTAA